MDSPDLCHVRLFGHPPRDRSEKVPNGFTPFVYRREPYGDANREPQRGLTEKEQEEALIEEVKRNGYGEGLVTREGESLLTVADRKLKHSRCRFSADDEQVKNGRKKVGELRVKNRAQMLALLLYTGGKRHRADSTGSEQGDHVSLVELNFLT